MITPLQIADEAAQVCLNSLKSPSMTHSDVSDIVHRTVLKSVTEYTECLKMKDQDGIHQD